VWDSARFRSIFLASSFFCISCRIHAHPHAGNANRWATPRQNHCYLEQQKENIMSIGLSEIIIIIINLALVIGIPAIIILAGIRLIRRINTLETRIEKLESKQGTNLDKTS
jgi:hypothetical protein